MDSRFQIFGAKTTPDIRSGFLGIVIGPETILPDMSGGPTDFREDCWSCDPTHLYKFSFLFYLKLSYEFWFQMTQLFLRKTSFNFEI